MKANTIIHWIGIALLAVVLAAHGAGAQDVRGPIYRVQVNSPITGPTAGFLRDALRRAESSNATALIITLSNGGGVLRDVRPLASDLAGAKVPVVVYVAPSGTDSGAAGALLLSAAHVAAMAPGTTFGSPLPLASTTGTLSNQSRDLVLDSVAAQLRTWNNSRGRNTDWIERAVREGAILTNEQAFNLSPPAIDVVADSDSQLLTFLDGRRVQLPDGSAVTVQAAGRATTPISPTVWQSVLLVLGSPTVAFTLLVLGALAVCLEFAAPGTTIFAGVGVVLLIGALIGLFMLPVQPWALLLLLLGLMCMGAEFFVASHGGLAVAGLVLVVIGGLNLIDQTQAPGVQASPVAVLGTGGLLGVFVALGAVLAVRSRRQPVRVGEESLIGRVAEVRRALEPEGMVFLDGALWQAVSENGDAATGEAVRVVGRHRLRLIVERIAPDGDT